MSELLAPKALLNLPKVHMTHVKGDEAPVTVPYRFLPHATQAVCPVYSEYVPIAQLWHVETVVAPNTELKVPLSHALQTELDVPPVPL